MTTATVAPVSGNQLAVLLVLAGVAVLAICAVLYQHERIDDRQGTTIAEHTEQLATLAGRIQSLADFLEVDINDPVDDSPAGEPLQVYAGLADLDKPDDSPAALLAEPHLSGLAGGSEDLADLLPGRTAGLGVPGLSGDFTTQRGVEDLQSVQGVQLARDVTEVVRQPVEDRGTEFVADRLLVPIANHEVAEDVPQPAEGLAGAVVPRGVVVDGESGDCHGVKGALTSRPCQDGLDA